MTHHFHSSTHVIGIVGPPCSGKSAVAEVVESLGGVRIDADSIAKRQLDEPEVIDALVGFFGKEILQPDGQISRSAIANLVFGEDADSHARLKRLESVIHPRTRAVIQGRLDQAKAQAAPFVILDVPLLIESGWDDQCDEVWCVEVPPKRLGDLLSSRGWTMDEWSRRQQRQLPLQAKRERADWVIVNDGSIDQLQERVTQRLRNTVASEASQEN